MGGEPLYLRVERDLASQISEGIWSEGEYLPSEQALQERYQVSRTTIRKAIGDLIIDGLLEIDRGNGTRVVGERPGAGESNIMSFSAAMRALGRHPGIREAHACVMDSLDKRIPIDQIPAGRIVHLSRVYTADGEPVSVSESWLPASAFAGINVDALAACESLYDELSAVDAGVSRVSDRYGIAVACEAEAAELDVPVGTSLLCVDRIGYTAQNRLIETSRIVVRTDRYRPTITTRKN